MHETKAGSTDTAEPRDDDRWAPHVVRWYVAAGVLFVIAAIVVERVPLLFSGMVFWMIPMFAHIRPYRRSPFWMRSHRGAAQTVGAVAVVIIGLALATAPIEARWAAVTGAVIALVGIAALVALAVRERRADVRREIARYDAEQRREIEQRNDAEQRPLAEGDRPM